MPSRCRGGWISSQRSEGPYAVLKASLCSEGAYGMLGGSLCSEGPYAALRRSLCYAQRVPMLCSERLRVQSPIHVFILLHFRQTRINSPTQQSPSL